MERDYCCSFLCVVRERYLMLQREYCYSEVKANQKYFSMLGHLPSVEKYIFTVCKRSCGKVMFSQACVKKCVGGGVSARLGRTPPPRQADTPPPQQTATGMHSCETCEEKFENLGSPLSLKDFQSYCTILLLYFHDLNICPMNPVFNMAATMCVI